MAPNVTWNRADVMMNSTFSFQSMSAIETLMSCFCCGYYIRLYRCRNNRVCDIDLLINFTNELFLISYKIVFVFSNNMGYFENKYDSCCRGPRQGSSAKIWSTIKLVIFTVKYLRLWQSQKSLCIYRAPKMQ